MHLTLRSLVATLLVSFYLVLSWFTKNGPSQTPRQTSNAVWSRVLSALRPPLAWVTGAVKWRWKQRDLSHPPSLFPSLSTPFLRMLRKATPLPPQSRKRAVSDSRDKKSGMFGPWWRWLRGHAYKIVDDFANILFLKTTLIQKVDTTSGVHSGVHLFLF